MEQLVLLGLIAVNCVLVVVNWRLQKRLRYLIACNEPASEEELNEIWVRHDHHPA